MSTQESRAVRIHAAGGPEQLVIDTVSVGDPGPGQVRIRHHAIGLKPMKEGKTPKRDMKNTLQMEHLAFEVDDVELLKKAKAYLKSNGIPIVFEGRKGAGCNISINFLDPDGYEFEIYCEMDQVGADGRLRPQSMFKPRDPLEDAIENPVEPKW